MMLMIIAALLGDDEFRDLLTDVGADTIELPSKPTRRVVAAAKAPPKVLKKISLLFLL